MKHGLTVVMVAVALGASLGLAFAETGRAATLDLPIWRADDIQGAPTYTRPLKPPSDAPTLQSAQSITLPGPKDTWTWATTKRATFTMSQDGFGTPLPKEATTSFEMRTRGEAGGKSAEWTAWKQLTAIMGTAKDSVVLAMPPGTVGAEFRAMPTGQTSWQIETHLLLETAKQ